MAQRLPVRVGRLADHPANQRRAGGQVQRGKRQPLGVEIVEGQRAVGLEDDRLCARVHGLRVDAVGKPLLDEHRVMVIRLGLGQQVAHVDRLAGTRHAEHHRVLRTTVARFTRERLDADDVLLIAVVDRLRRGEVPGERAGKRQQVGQVVTLRIKAVRGVLAPGPAGPAHVEEFLGRRGDVGLEILRAVHGVDRALDGRRARRQPLARAVPDAHDEQRVKRQRHPVHERLDFALLLGQDRQEGHTLFSGVVARDPVVGFFLLEDLRAHGQGSDVDCNGIVEDALGRQPADQARERALGPLAQGQDGVVVPIHEKARIRQAHALREPAVFLDGFLGAERGERVVVEARRDRRVEEAVEVAEVLVIVHRQHARALARENGGGQFVELLELAREFGEQLVIVVLQRPAGELDPGTGLDAAT